MRKGINIRVISHSLGCKHQQPCEYVGLIGIIEEVNKYDNLIWVRLSNGILGKFSEKDLEII